MKRRQLITSDQAVQTRGQTKRPCSDCPFARTALPGWLGGDSIQQWLQYAHGEFKVDCHTRKDNQCAGLSIYRANVGKRCRDQSILVLPDDDEAVFASPQEFAEHHERIGLPPARKAQSRR